MQKQIHIRQFCFAFLLIDDPPLLRAQHVVQDLLAEGGDEDLVLLRGGLEREGGEELPDGLVDDVDGARCRWGLPCDIGMCNAGGWEEEEEVG